MALRMEYKLRQQQLTRFFLVILCE